MNRFLIAFAALFTFNTCSAQLSSLSENFNSSCPAAGKPYSWDVYNPINSTIPHGQWQCAASYGRSGTTGISCTGLYGPAPLPLTYHIDTSFLISPELDLHGYTGNIYVNFDTKTTNFNLGAKFEIFVSGDSTMGYDTSSSVTDTVYNRTSATLPIFSINDQTDWVTHQVDITAYKHIVPLHIGFRYTSASGSVGSRWYLDNIETTTTPLGIDVIYPSSDKHSLQVKGSVNSGTLTLTMDVLTSGNYDISVFDMTGRTIYRQQVSLQAGQSVKSFSGFNISAGLYLVKMGNETSFGTAKVYAQ